MSASRLFDFQNVGVAAQNDRVAAEIWASRPATLRTPGYNPVSELKCLFINDEKTEKTSCAPFTKIGDV